jgi:hypothetical protein
MKKTALILAFLVCFINYQGFAKGLFEKKPQKIDENIATKDDLKKMGDSIIANMNEEFKKRATGAPVPGTPGGGTTVSPQNQGTSERIPVTPRIVQQFLLKDDENSSGLKFYISEAIVVKIFESKETAEIVKKDYMIVLNNPQSPDTPKKTIEFSKDSEGVINGFGPESDRSRQIKIRFPDLENRTLIFTRNMQRESYELTEVEVLDDKIRRVDNSPFSIQLMIAGRNDRKTEIKVMPAEYAYMNNQQQENIFSNNNYSNTSYYNASTPQPNVNYNRAVNTSRSVIGTGSTNPQRVIAFAARKRNSALSNSEIVIINEYFNEARYEGVNVDLAIAQMLHATDYFRNRERMANCNYGGLSGASFQNWTIGVRAHIQHLKAYANQKPNRGEIVDPRFYVVYGRRGFNGITFDQVYPIWSERSDYRQKIEEILRNL